MDGAGPAAEAGGVPQPDGGGRARVLAVAGPTAVGKSALTLAVAEAIGGEIVVADPFQRYRGLEIAADAPGEADLARVPHHCVGDLDLSERSTAADFALRAHRAIDAILARGRTPIVSGGTGLYLRAALADLHFAPEPPEAIRRAAEEQVDRDPATAAQRLEHLAPAVAARIDRANPRRLARALAVALARAEGGAAGGGPPAAGGGEGEGDAGGLWSADTRHPTLAVVLTRSREVLDARIALRVERELGDGLVGELRRALARPDLAREPAQIIGMREVAQLDRGEIDDAELGRRLAARTRRLARAQLTWLRKLPRTTELALGGGPESEATDTLLGLWRTAEGRGAD